MSTGPGLRDPEEKDGGGRQRRTGQLIAYDYQKALMDCLCMCLPWHCRANKGSLHVPWHGYVVQNLEKLATKRRNACAMPTWSLSPSQDPQDHEAEATVARALSSRKMPSASCAGAKASKASQAAGTFRSSHVGRMHPLTHPPSVARQGALPRGASRRQGGNEKKK